MTISLPDIYIYTVPEGLALQGATQRGIDHLKSLKVPLINGTIAVIAMESADQAFDAIDAVGLQTMTFG